MYIDGVMYYTAEEVLGGASLFGIVVGFATIGIVLLMKEFFK